MSLVDKLKEMIGTLADGHHHALIHLAEQVEGIQAGGAAALPEGALTKIQEDLSEKLHAYMVGLGKQMADARDEFSAKLAEIEAAIAALQSAAAASVTPATPPESAPVAADAGTNGPPAEPVVG